MVLFLETKAYCKRLFIKMAHQRSWLSKPQRHLLLVALIHKRVLFLFNRMFLHILRCSGFFRPWRRSAGWIKWFSLRRRKHQTTNSQVSVCTHIQSWWLLTFCYTKQLMSQLVRIKLNTLSSVGILLNDITVFLVICFLNHKNSSLRSLFINVIKLWVLLMV